MEIDFISPSLLQRVQELAYQASTYPNLSAVLALADLDLDLMRLIIPLSRRYIHGGGLR